MEVLPGGKAGMNRIEAAASASMLEDISIRPFSAISRRPTFQPNVNSSASQIPETPKPRKTLLRCFEEARHTFQKKIADPLRKDDPKRLPGIEEFLRGMKLDDLGKACQELSQMAEDKVNNKASKLLVTLDQFKGAGDALLQFAPESVSIVWFGISSLISIGSAKVQTRLMICGACDSIANIVADFIRWESMAALMVSGDKNVDDIWESDVPHLVFLILEFLWSAKPHFDQSRVKRIASNLKEVFNNELQERVTAILEKYEGLVRAIQGQFQDSMLQGSFKTGKMLDQIRENLQSYVSVGASLVSSFQKKILLDELDRQQAKLDHPASYKLHFSTLNDRLTKIIHDRKGRLAANWLFSEEEYCEWKTLEPGPGAKSADFLCLRGPRGHGKSVAMMSIHRDITKTTLELKERDSERASTALVCHFFFKKGEQDIERARSSLESILYQLLGSDEIRKDPDVLSATVNLLNPGFTDADSGNPAENRGTNEKSSESFRESLRSLCNTIKKVAVVIPVPVYLMIDALDECIDRREQCFLEHLKYLVDKPNAEGGTLGTSESTKSENLKLVISARDSVDIISELANPQHTAENPDTNTVIQDCGVKIVNITSEKNSSDLEEYLQHSVGEVLSRRIDRAQYEAYYDSQLSRIVKIVHEKANGDFTLARLIIANLQQPSKDTLEKRIKRLPSAIGEIYRASLESLTADEQEFVVAALKWVVWSVSGLTVLEISDHYKEIYKDSEVSEGESTFTKKQDGIEENTDEEKSDQKITDQEELGKDAISDKANLEPKYESPFDNPEVKDTIYHIENAGRDFFKYDRNTGVVNVDISIREWVQQDVTESNNIVKDSKGFNKFRDDRGNTVFQFTLAPSFVRYGETLSQLFDKKEAHMSIALDILRTLNNEEFQDRYMPWRPVWAIDKSGLVVNLGYDDPQPNTSPRYEIEHWHDHILALQEWWTEDSINSSWWAELLTQISIFTRPENWYRWNVQRPCTGGRELRLKYYGRTEDLYGNDLWKAEFLQRAFEEPIHFACKMGLHLLIDCLVQQAKVSVQSSEGKCDQARCRRIEKFKTMQVHALECDRMIDREGISRRSGWGRGSKSEGYIWTKHQMVLGKLILGMGTEEATKLLKRLDTKEHANHSQIPPVIKQLTESKLHPKGGIVALVQETADLRSGLSASEILCNSEDIFGRAPLCLAGEKPIIIKRLLKYGANINGSSILGPSRQIRPLKVILEKLIDLEHPLHIIREKPKKRAALLKTAEIFILEGADLQLGEEENPEKETTCLHLAASIQDLKLFKLLCVSGDWNIHTQDIYGHTPLHCLFRDPKSRSPDEVKDVLSILKMMVKMQKEEDLINMENYEGRNVLAFAVQSGLVKAVEILVEMGADVHDEDISGANCFHHLAQWTLDDETNLKIADVLLQAGLDYLKRDNAGRTPLFHAAKTGRWPLARFLLKKYDEMAEKSQQDRSANPLLPLPSGDKRTLFHAAAIGAESTGDEKIPATDRSGAIEFFKELNVVLSKYTDTASLILQPDSCGNTALHIALIKSLFKLVETIISINPNTSHINHALNSPWDLAIGNLVRRRAWSKPEVWAAEWRAAAEVLQYLRSHGSSTSSQFPFELYMRFIGNADRDLEDFKLWVSDYPGMTEIIDQYNAGCKDLHGWSFFDYDSRMALPFLSMDRYTAPERVSSPQSEFAIPTRMGWTSCPMGLSNNGLELFSIAPTPDLYQFALADHPLPPIERVFYFEVALSSKVPSFKSSGIFCEIGLRSPGLERPEYTCDLFDGRISVNSYDYEWPYSDDSTPGPEETQGDIIGSNIPKEDISNPFLSPEETSSGPFYVGCGVNPVQHAIFFTLNGSVVFENTHTYHSIYYPFIGFSNYSDKLKVNFGAEKFVFEAANSQDWTGYPSARPLDSCRFPSWGGPNDTKRRFQEIEIY
ncbi:hypothetical protein TWF718_011236 [Orbilia javanica]|uniref:Nephrocystin 3-like N-terminal domain-containing protein n=1 Tax=Orbilia javanica TaxID=47235 RepID=A0AAN8MTF3_9PEZI